MIGHGAAYASRNAPFEKGRWRLGSLAYRMIEGDAARDRRIVRTRHGFDMALDLAQFVDRTIYCTGEWEPHETAVIRRVLRAGDTFVDVGANIGYFSLLGAKLVGPRGRVHAFEANPATACLLQTNLDRNGAANVVVHALAVGEEAGQATIHEPEDGNMGSDFASPCAGGSGGLQVRMDLIDAVVKAERVRLIKLDIEGGEAKALRGARGLLADANAPDLLFEYAPSLLERAGDNGGELLEWLRGLGYALHEIAMHDGGDRGRDAVQTYYHAIKGRAVS